MLTVFQEAVVRTLQLLSALYVQNSSQKSYSCEPELAELLDLGPCTLRRVLRFVVQSGYAVEDLPGIYRLDPTSWATKPLTRQNLMYAGLVSHAPSSLRSNLSQSAAPASLSLAGNLTTLTTSCYVPPACRHVAATYFSGAVSHATLDEDAMRALAENQVPLEPPAPRTHPQLCVSEKDTVSQALFRLGDARAATLAIHGARYGPASSLLEFARSQALGGFVIVVSVVGDEVWQPRVGEELIHRGTSLVSGSQLLPLVLGGSPLVLPETGWRFIGVSSEGISVLRWDAPPPRGP